MRLGVVGVGDFGRAVIGEIRNAGIDVAVVPDGLGDDAIVAVIAARPVPAVARELDRASQPLVPVWGMHGKLQIGPVVTGTAACFACYEARLRQHAVDLEAHDAVVRHWCSVPPPSPVAAVAQHATLAATELARLLRDPGSAAGEVWRYDAAGTRTEGRVTARHRCPCRQGQRP